MSITIKIVGRAPAFYGVLKIKDSDGEREETTPPMTTASDAYKAAHAMQKKIMEDYREI